MGNSVSIHTQVWNVRQANVHGMVLLLSLGRPTWQGAAGKGRGNGTRLTQLLS